MIEKFNEIVSKILLVHLDDITPGLTKEEVEDWDSMSHLILISDLEEEFKIKFTDDEVVEIHKIQDIIDLLAKNGVNLTKQ